MTLTSLPDDGPYSGVGNFSGNHFVGTSWPPATTTAVSKIDQFAASLRTAADAISQLISTPFIPVSFWPLPNGVAIKDFPNPRLKHPRESTEEHAWRREVACASASAAVLYGDEIGFTPIASLQAVYVVRGRPGLYAEAMVALLKSHGHHLVVEELTDHRCVVRARRVNEDEWQRFPFTMQRADKAGYVRQNTKYRDDPQSMLYARAASIACRAVAPDVLKGIMGVEELQDEPDTPAVAASRTVKRTDPARRPVPSIAGEQAPSDQQAPAQPAPDGPPLPGEVQGPPTSTGRPIGALDERQWAAINREFVRLEVVGEGQKANRLAVISRIVGRPITRGQDLSAEDGQRVLDNLAGDVGFEVVAEALDLPRDPAPAEPAEPVQDELGGADPDGDQEYDPTAAPDWGAEGEQAQAPADQGWPALPGEDR